jgi:hypothetical protein
MLHLVKRSIPKFTLFFKNTDESMLAKRFADPTRLSRPANTLRQFSETIRTMAITQLGSV